MSLCAESCRNRPSVDTLWTCLRPHRHIRGRDRSGDRVRTEDRLQQQFRPQNPAGLDQMLMHQVSIKRLNSQLRIEDRCLRKDRCPRKDRWTFMVEMSQSGISNICVPLVKRLLTEL